MTKPLTKGRLVRIVLILGLATIATAIVGVAFGGHALEWAHLSDRFQLLRNEHGLVGALRRVVDARQGDVELAILGYRIKRVLLAFVVGASLAAAGAALQAVLRNPLADPYILGVSGGAALGAAVIMVLPAVTGWLVGSSFAPGFAALPVGAFLGGLVATLLVAALAARGSGPLGHRLLLTGVVLNFLFSATIMVLIWWAAPSEKIGVLYWLMGNLSFSGASLGQIGGVLLCSLAVVWMLTVRGNALNLLSLGDLAAGRLGVPVRQLAWLVMGAASLLTGLAVALAGLVGFVGLIVPHALRLVFGPDHRQLIVSSFLMGGSFLIAADLLARLLTPEELPVGVVTALVGGPLFLWLLRRRPWVGHGEGGQ